MIAILAAAALACAPGSFDLDESPEGQQSVECPAAPLTEREQEILERLRKRMEDYRRGLEHERPR